MTSTGTTLAHILRASAALAALALMTACQPTESAPIAEPETVQLAEPLAEPIAEPETVQLAEPIAEPIEPETVQLAEPIAEPETVQLAEPETVQLAEPICHEDAPCWNCATMGNLTCGPIAEPSTGPRTLAECLDVVSEGDEGRREAGAADCRADHP
jgi:hypothetical protein